MAQPEARRLTNGERKMDRERTKSIRPSSSRCERAPTRPGARLFGKACFLVQRSTILHPLFVRLPLVSWAGSGRHYGNKNWPFGCPPIGSATHIVLFPYPELTFSQWRVSFLPGGCAISDRRPSLAAGSGMAMHYGRSFNDNTATQFRPPSIYPASPQYGLPGSGESSC